MRRRAPFGPLSGLPSTYLKACALLRLSEAPAHGYELLRRLSEIAPAPFEPGALYRVLRSLEAEGLATSAWEESAAGPDRRVYSITAAGREALRAQAEALEEVAGHVGNFLRRYTRIARRVIAA